MTNGLRLYEHLLTFSEYREQNDNPLQQAVYSDMVRNLSEANPKSDAEAVVVVYRLLSSLLDVAASVPEDFEYYSQLHEEIQEILAIVAHYKD